MHRETFISQQLREVPLKSHLKPTKFRISLFSLIELCVICSILSIFTSLFMPSLRQMQQRTKALHCLSNLSGHGKSISYYQNDYNDHVPLGDIINHDLVPEHMKNSTNAMRISAKHIEPGLSTSGNFLAHGALAMAMYDHSPAQDVIRDHGPNLTTRDIRDDIIRSTSDEYQHFRCPSQDEAAEFIWLNDPDRILEHMSPHICRFKSDYGTNTGVVGVRGNEAQGRISKVNFPSKNMYLTEVKNIQVDNKVGWSSLQTWKYDESPTLLEFYEDQPEPKKVDIYRHQLNVNVLFVDGHAEQVHVDSFDKVWMTKGISP